MPDSAISWTAICQASLSFTISQSLLRLLSIEPVTPSNHLILCHPFLTLPLIFPSIRVFSSELALCIRWPKCWSFSFSINLSNEYSGLVSFRIDWLVSLQFKRLSSVFSNITGLCYGKSEKRWSYSCTQWSLTKENWEPKDWCFQTVELDKTLESPLGSK